MAALIVAALVSSAGPARAQDSSAEEIERGTVLFEEKRYDDALDVFFTLSAMGQHLPIARYYLGRIHYIKGDVGRAHDDIEKALADSSDYADALGFQAYMYMNEGKTVEAMKSWRLFELAIEGRESAAASTESIMLPEEYRAKRVQEAEEGIPDSDFPMPVTEYVERLNASRALPEGNSSETVQASELSRLLIFVLAGAAALLVLVLILRFFRNGNSEFIEEKIVPPAKTPEIRASYGTLHDGDYIEIEDVLPEEMVAPLEPYARALFLKRERERQSKVIARLLAKL